MEPTLIKEFRDRIGAAIRKLRGEERITTKFLAKVLGVAQPTISRIENGTASISAEKLCFLAKSFNRPLSYFVGERSSVYCSEDDVLRAGLVFYGAGHLKSKRTIDVLEHYRSYADFLNAALSDADEARFTSALATTLYKQAADGRLRITKVVATVQHEQLIVNLVALIEKLVGVERFIDRPRNEKSRAFALINELRNALLRGRRSENYNSTVPDMDSKYIAKFINTSLNHE